MSSFVDTERKRIKEELGYDYMDPLSDVAFKSIFTMDKKHTLIKILAKEFLEVDLNNIKVRHPGFIAKGKNKKGEETDYYFEIDNKKVTIECNRKYNAQLFERNKSHLRRSIIDSNDFEVVQINFDGYDILNLNKAVYKFYIKEESTDSDLYKELIQIFHINLSYFAKILKEGYNSNKKLSIFDKMCLIFQVRTRKVLEEIVKGEDELMNIKKAIEDINNNEGAWRKYTKAELELIIEAKEAMEKGMKQGMEKGMKQGMEKGMEKGMAEGIEKGIEQGIEQGKKEQQIEIAKNMLEKGMDINTIIELTALTEQEIKNINM